ncbi:MAG: DUF4062 domain-containing protein, partial [Terriglobia bacterium]
MDRKNNIPVVFISSTVEDLEPYRAAARDAALSAGFHPDMFEHWPASGQRRPAAECLSRVSKADVLVVIVAHRYGWMPGSPDQPPNQRKSITWLECERAHDKGKEVLAFLVDKDAGWHDKLKDSYRLAAAAEEGKDTEELRMQVRQDIAGLKDFKRWLGDGRIRATFKNFDEFEGKLAIALRDWRDRHPEFAKPLQPVRAGQHDPRKYLEYLRGQTAWIDIRGLQVGTGKAHKFPIEDLYIRLTTASTVGELD